MKRAVLSSIGIAALFLCMLPYSVFAQSYIDDWRLNEDGSYSYEEEGDHTAAARSLVERINDVILFPLISLMLGVALLVFLWGAFQFVYQAGNDGAREVGRRHMLWGVIGFVIMLSALTILQIAAGTFGISVPNN